MAPHQLHCEVRIRDVICNMYKHTWTYIEIHIYVYMHYTNVGTCMCFLYGCVYIYKLIHTLINTYTYK